MSDRWSPNTTVACVVEQAGRYLVVKEKDKKNPQQFCLNQPAGHLEPNETLIDAAIRETLEETGWSVDVQHLVGIYLFPSSEPLSSDPLNARLTSSDSDTLTYLRFCFYAKALEHHTHLELDQNIVEARWMTLEEIKNSPIPTRNPIVVKVIEDYLHKQMYPLNLLHHVLTP